MALVTRTLSNADAPLYHPDGTAAAGATITFTLVDAKGNPVDAWDAETGERVTCTKVTATVDGSGEFDVELWPNDRGSTVTQYHCKVNIDGVRPFRASIAESEDVLTWVAFMAQGATLTAQELTGVSLHIADATAAHAATAISFDPDESGLDATTVQEAIDLVAAFTGLDGDLAAIAALTPTNDDILQRKAGAWTNRTVAQLVTDIGLPTAVLATTLAGLSTASAAAITSSSTVLQGFGQLQAQTTALDAATVKLAGSYADPAWITSLATSKLTGLGTGVATFLATPSSANLAAAVTDETGSGALVFGTSPTLATPVINGLPTGTGIATANTASTLVARDGSGNFSAGTITASLTGTASNASQLLNATWAAPAAIGSTTPAAGTFTELRATGNLIVDGEIQQNGAVVVFDATNVSVEDPLVKVARGNTGNSLDIGVYGQYQPAATVLYTGMYRDATDGKFKFFHGLEEEPTTTVNTAGTGYTASTLVANLEGNVTGAVTGNASTATALATARAINGVNFDGTAAITVTAAAGTLTGATLAANVLASSLTSVGTLVSLSVSGALAAGATTITGTLSTTSNITLAAAGDGAIWNKYTNNGGDHYCGIENSAGSAFGGTAYAFFTYVPAGKVIQSMVAGTGVVTTTSSTGLAITGTLSTTKAGVNALTVTSSDGDLAKLTLASTGNNAWHLSCDTVMRVIKDSTEIARWTTNGLRFAALPTSTAGLTTGDLWNDSGTVKIV
jgi:hypothetical protein